MDDDIRAPLNGTAVDGRRKGIIDDQRDFMRVSDLREHLDIDNVERGIGDGLDEYRLGIGLEAGCKLVSGDRRADKIEVDSQITQGLIEQIEGAAVDRGGRDDMVAGLGDIGDTDQGRRLTGSGQHRADAALKRGDLLRDGIEGGIRQTGIEKAVGFEIEELSHRLGGIINKSSALDDRQDAGIAVFRLIAGLYAFCIQFHFINLQINL